MTSLYDIYLNALISAEWSDYNPILMNTELMGIMCRAGYEKKHLLVYFVPDEDLNPNYNDMTPNDLAKFKGKTFALLMYLHRHLCGRDHCKMTMCSNEYKETDMDNNPETKIVHVINPQDKSKSSTMVMILLSPETEIKTDE
jgi:hypothetical protein